VLRLRGEAASSRRIRWAEDVIDNEGMGKKSSKGTYDTLYIVTLKSRIVASSHRRHDVVVASPPISFVY
jgi:protein phosphatase 1 regulatory subunit 11